MRFFLEPHPTSLSDAIDQLAVEIQRTSPLDVSARFRLTGRLDQLNIPGPASAVHTDELWRDTCFEVFLKLVEGEAYEEFNFSPSGQWAAYSFSGYREGMTRATHAVDPTSNIRTAGDEIKVSAKLNLTGSAVLTPDEDWVAAVAAVVKSKDASMSYWALAHPVEKPDFHHAGGFVCVLARAD